MTPDVHTLYFVVVLLNLLQIIALYTQYRINKSYKGVGWWLLWGTFEFIGFGLTFLRDIPGMFEIVVTLQNSCIAAGSVFVYIGVARFLNKKENLLMITAISALFFIGFFYFLFFNDNSDYRGIVINLALTSTAFLTAWTMLINRISSISLLMQVIAGALIIHGGILFYRSYLMVAVSTPIDMFDPVFYNLLPVFDAMIIGLVLTFGFIMLINQRLQHDITLTKNHFQSIFAVSPGAVLISTTDDGKIVEVNDIFTQITGIKREESIGKTTTEIGLWKSVTDRESLINDIKENGYCYNREVVLNRKSGEEFVGLISARLISLNDQPHVISITQDVTEKYLAEEILKASEEKYRTLAETTPDVVLLHDFNGVITYINKTGLKLMHKPENEIVGRSLSEFVPANFFQEVNERQKLRHSGCNDTLEYKTVIERNDGELIKLWVRSTPIFKQGKMESFLLVAHDITEQENYLTELTRAKEQAEEMNKIKSYFFANMSHELRTPFVGILGYSQLISERLGNPDQRLEDSELKKMVQRIIQSSERLMFTLNKILDLSKLEFEEVAVSVSEFDLNPLLNEVSHTFQKIAWDKNLEIFFRELPIDRRIISDEKMLRSILINIVSNAVKYTTAGKVSLSANIIRREDNEELVITVSDTGIGIPADKIEVIWGAFRQVSEGHGRSFEGTGLGLTITKKYVEMLGGEIFLESVEGKGSIFTVVLPLKYSNRSKNLTV